LLVIKGNQKRFQEVNFINDRYVYPERSMAYCSKCGVIVGENAKFCGACGTSVSSVAIPSEPKSERSLARLSPNAAGALSYVGFLLTGIIFLVIEPYRNDRFIKFHAFQSILFSAAIIAGGIILRNMSLMFVIRFGQLYALFQMIDNLYFLAVFLFWLYLMHRAYNNESYMIPVIGPMALKQAGK
jgi:uncharacterized membrane protein